VTPRDAEVIILEAERLEGTCKESETQLVAIKSRNRRGDGWNAGTSGVVVKPPIFDVSTSWKVFHSQFQTVADHDAFSAREVLNLLLILHSAPAGST
jgi:hypothetical protein